MLPNNSSVFVDGDSDSEEESNGADSDQLDSNSNSASKSASKSDDSWKDCDDEKTTDSEASDLFSSLEEESSSEQPDNNAPKPTTRLLASATAVAAVCSIYALEKHRQKKLTRIPLVMGQIPPGSQMKSICGKLQTSNGESEYEKSGGVLNRPIVPSLFVGTNGQLASAAAYLNSGPSSSVPFVVRFSETLVSSYDGAEIHLDWEVPNHQHNNNNNNKNNKKGGREKEEDNKPATSRKTAILLGNISHPTILILHGINNSSQYGYIKSLQRTMTDRGWNAVAMNFRGCAKDNRGIRNFNNTIPMTTPRSYTASYTGDLRSIVHQLTGRMTDNYNNNNICHQPQQQLPPLFLVGNSLGANLVTKYLGEEGLAGTLPRNVVGGVSLGNPFRFRADHIHTLPFGAMMGAARKANYFFQRKAMAISMPGNTNTTNNNNTNKVHVHSDPRTITLASLDKVLAPTMIRTVSHPPYETKIGYGHEKSGNSSTSNAVSSASDSAADAYWADSSCYKQGRHVSVPLLHIIARDDNLCYESAKKFMSYSLQNPNVVVVQTRTGGHLGWWHTPSSASSTSSPSWGLNSWADGATADFIRAVMETNAERNEANNNPNSNHQATIAAATIDDAHNLFASNRISSNRNNESISSDDNSSSNATRGTGTSMRALPGDCDGDGDSTIATNDHSNYNNNNITSIPRAAARSPQTSRTYFQFQRVLLLQQQQHHKDEENLERNRLLEKYESIELARLFRSRL